MILILFQTKDRLNEKRSSFGMRGKSVPDAFLATADYIGNPKQIAKYAKYALRDDGPNIWGTPAPQGLRRGEPGYTVSPLPDIIH